MPRIDQHPRRSRAERRALAREAARDGGLRARLAGEASARFVDVGGGGAAVTSALLRASFGFLVGAGIVFVALLIAAMVGEEVFWELSEAIELDLLARAGAGAALVIAAATGVVLPALFAADAALFLRRLESASVDAPALPAARARARVATAPARMLRRMLLAVGLMGASAAAIAGIIVLTESGATEQQEFWIMLGVGSVLTVMWLALRPLLIAAEARWIARVHPLTYDWSGRQGFVAQAEERRREAAARDDGPSLLAPGATRRLEWLTAGAGIAVGLSAALWFLSVAIRQPCRRCDPRYYDEPVEQFIDGLSLVGGVLIAVTAAGLVLLLLANLIVLRVREITAARWVVDGRARRAPADRAERFLVGGRATVFLGQAVVAAVAPAAVIVALADAWFDVSWADAGIGFTIAAVAFVAGAGIAWLDDGPATRERNALRVALSPGDPTAKEIAARARAAAVQRRLDRAAAKREPSGRS
ncbi:hypothetical protein ACGGZK_18545 [Agromyces sp. MMS24-K17]|uniref:hypothetical protein n=1 Tax=Agromyces sp. MMS24-K17 TaxID=3372850 RepID=UPI0037552C79